MDDDYLVSITHGAAGCFGVFACLLTYGHGNVLVTGLLVWLIVSLFTLAFICAPKDGPGPP